MLGTKTLGVAFLFCALLNVVIYRELWATRPLALRHISAGERDAVLVHVPERRVVLIGAGPDASILRTLGEALPPWRKRIDALVLSDMSAAHAGGAPFVLARYRVGTVLKAEEGTPAREAAIAEAARGIPVMKVPPHGRVLLHYGNQTLDLSSL